MKKEKMLSIVSSLMLIAPLMGTSMTVSANKRVHHNHAPRVAVMVRTHKNGRKHLRKINVKPAATNLSKKTIKRDAKVAKPVIGFHGKGKKGLKVNLAYFLKGNQKILQNKNYQNVLKVGLSKQGDKYVWGAAGPKYFDCSGLMQYMFKKGMHEHIPRIVNDQCKWTHHRVSAKNRRPGDFIQFSNGTHIGMYIGHGYMLDAQNFGVGTELVNVPWWNATGYYRPNYK